MSRMIFFDVDGTLVDSKYHNISQSTMQALNQLKNNGYLIGISTGRGYDSFLKSGVQNLFSWDGFVCNNGQIVLDKDHNVLFKKMMSRNTVEKVIELATKLNLPVIVKTKNRFLTLKADENVKECHKLLNNEIPKVGKYTGEEVNAMTLYAPLNFDFTQFKEIEDLEVVPGNHPFADLGVSGVSKYTGIKILLDYYQMDGYIAFGDSMNDAVMFEHSDISVAMGQGNEELKRLASYVTDSIENDGIYKACVHLNLI